MRFSIIFQKWFFREGWRLVFFTFVVFGLYGHTLNAPFVLDDIHNIVDNEFIRLDKLTAPGLVSAAMDGYSPNRPIPKLSFALNYFFHGYNPVGYHLVNIIIHILAGIVLYYLFKATLSLPAAGRRVRHPDKVVFFAALLWLAHPVQTQSVTYIVQRMNSMAVLFCALSLLCYVRGRISGQRKSRVILYVLAASSFFLAINSKQNAGILPFIILLYEWFFFQDLDRRRIIGSFKWLALAGIIILGLGFVYLGASPVERLLGGFERRDFTFVERILTEWRVVLLYMTLIVFPHPTRLNLEYDYPVSHSMFDPMTTFISLCVIAGLIGFAFFIARKHRVAAFCIFWFFLNLIIESSFFPLELVFEHRLYMPSMFVCLLPALLSFRYLGEKGAVAALCCVIVVFGIWTWQRNLVWTNKIALYKDCVIKSSEKWRPVQLLAGALFEQGRYGEALPYLEKTIAKDKEFIELQLSLKRQREKQGKQVYALLHHKIVEKVLVIYEEDLCNLGHSWEQLGHPERAERYFREAVRILPDSKKAHRKLGFFLGKQGRMDEAAIQFRQILRIDPKNTQAHARLGDILNASGQFAKAEQHYKAAIQENPGMGRAHFGLGMVLAKTGRAPEGIVHLKKAVQMLPDNVQIRTALAQIQRP